MAKEPTAKEAVEAPIVIPHGLELDADCVAIASDDESVTVERAGVKYRVTRSNHPAVEWDWIQIV
jgi:hypothetical protein